MLKETATRSCATFFSRIGLRLSLCYVVDVVLVPALVRWPSPPRGVVLLSLSYLLPRGNSGDVLPGLPLTSSTSWCWPAEPMSPPRGDCGDALLSPCHFLEVITALLPALASVAAHLAA